MPSVTIRNVPDEVHRAIRVRAAQHGCSAEAQMRAILEAAVRPSNRLKLGSLLAAAGRQVGLTEEEVRVLHSARDQTSARAASFK